ncbi:MAG: alpha/beta hydrolase [Burkholderiales bacterium]
MQEYFVQCLSPSGLHNMHYTEWGARANPRIVMCVHGLTRNCRDFDALAQSLEHDFRVICPDVVGRGQSEWLADKQHYGLAQYLADINTLLARLTADGPADVFWVGTSMGGMIGMLLASLPHTPVRKLILNDVGTLIPRASLERIAQYVGKSPSFKTLEETNAYVRTVSASFGPHTDAQWDHLTRHNARQNADGTWTMNYDPGIALPFQKSPINDIELWSYYDHIACPTLLLRGADSDLLLKDTALAMTQRGPKARLVEFAGVGHAPMLMADNQIKVVRDFLLT